MEHQSNYVPTTGFTRWMDSRLPVIRMAYDTILEFPTPRNLNYMWTFGGILAFCLGVQIVTGVVLAMHYAADTTVAFDSIEHLMRDVNYGWLMRYTHAVGASMFFIAVYLHIFRGLYYGSYKAPREILWIIGVLIFLAMIATAFMGYSLVWGQMSFWAVTVITNLFSSLDSVISGLGTTLVQWIWGGFSVNDATLNRLFSLHYLLPFVIAAPDTEQKLFLTTQVVDEVAEVQRTPDVVHGRGSLQRLDGRRVQGQFPGLAELAIADQQPPGGQIDVVARRPHGDGDGFLARLALDRPGHTDLQGLFDRQDVVIRPG